MRLANMSPEKAEAALKAAREKQEAEAERIRTVREQFRTDPRLAVMRAEIEARNKAKEDAKKAKREEVEQRRRAEAEGILYRRFRAAGGNEQEWQSQKAELMAEHFRQQALGGPPLVDEEQEQIKQYFRNRPAPTILELDEGF